MSSNKINSHVERLHRYLPFSPDHDQIYEEYQKGADSLNLATRALDYLVKAAEGGPGVVILTGDAGHGKTHLCRRLLEKHLGYTADEARDLINSSCDGHHAILAKSGEKRTPLRIFKDFSEPPVGDAAQKLEEAGARDGELAVICANEGRLRAILHCDRAGETCRRLATDFRESFRDGLASRDGEFHILNLNYQSVAGAGERNLVGSALKEWLNGTRWRVCGDCSAKTACPVYRNRQLLASSQETLAPLRQRRLAAMYATAERLGAVITIRELLMSLAYVITGGLSCKDVHERSRGQGGWQHAFAFYNLLFVRPEGLSADSLSRIPMLTWMARVDPASRAVRWLDERLVNSAGDFDEGDLDLSFWDPGQGRAIDASNGIDEIIGNPTNAKDRTREAEFVQKVVRSLRRRAFFDLDTGSVLARMGFEHGDDFEEIVGESLAPKRMAELKGQMLAGLHVIQGLGMAGRETNLHLVDPAFGNATSHAAIIAGKIPSKDVRMMSQAKAWEAAGGQGSWRMAEAVDWLDRTVILRLETPWTAGIREIPLNLLMFEFIARAGAGYAAESFYSHDARRLLNFLGRIAEAAPQAGGEITLFLDRRMHSISIDQGMIQVGGGN